MTRPHAHLSCTVTAGLRPAEATVHVREHDGTPQTFPLDRGLVDLVGGRPAIPVPVLLRAVVSGCACVGLPAEADSGAHRIWVRDADLIDGEGRT